MLQQQCQFGATGAIAKPRPTPVGFSNALVGGEEFGIALALLQPIGNLACLYLGDRLDARCLALVLVAEMDADRDRR